MNTFIYIKWIFILVKKTLQQPLSRTHITIYLFGFKHQFYHFIFQTFRQTSCIFWRCSLLRAEWPDVWWWCVSCLGPHHVQSASVRLSSQPANSVSVTIHFEVITISMLISVLFRKQSAAILLLKSFSFCSVFSNFSFGFGAAAYLHESHHTSHSWVSTL